jgi:hypothetical protein
MFVSASRFGRSAVIMLSRGPKHNSFTTERLNQIICALIAVTNKVLPDETILRQPHRILQAKMVSMAIVIKKGPIAKAKDANQLIQQ